MKNLLLLVMMLFCFVGNSKTLKLSKTHGTTEVFVSEFQKRPKTVHVRSCTRKNGTTVKSHYRSKPSRH